MLNQAAKTVLRDAGITPATWARANYMESGEWSGDACGCTDGRCKDGFHHYPDDECGCLRTMLDTHLSGEGQFDGEDGYVIRDPLWAQVRQARRRAGQHSGKPPSGQLQALSALDETLKLAFEWDQRLARFVDPANGARAECARELRDAITTALTGEEAPGGQ